MKRPPYETSLHNEIVLEQTRSELQVYPAPKIAPLKNWEKLFAATDTTPEKEFNDWDATLGDSIE